jgi:hypothetical protein
MGAAEDSLLLVLCASALSMCIQSLAGYGDVLRSHDPACCPALAIGLQAVTNFATTANGVLASTFLLYSVGLGAGAIPTAGALNWVLKDGVGQMGTLLFGKAIAHNFDIHSKTWYFMSFLLLSTATGKTECHLLLLCASLCFSCQQHFLGFSTVLCSPWGWAHAPAGHAGATNTSARMQLASTPCMCVHVSCLCQQRVVDTPQLCVLLCLLSAGLEIATILVPHAFLVLGSCANMIKGLSWMAGGSTRSVFNLSFVRDNNIAGAHTARLTFSLGRVEGAQVEALSGVLSAATDAACDLARAPATWCACRIP